MLQSASFNTGGLHVAQLLLVQPAGSCVVGFGVNGSLLVGSSIAAAAAFCNHAWRRWGHWSLPASAETSAVPRYDDSPSQTEHERGEGGGDQRQRLHGFPSMSIA